MPLATRVRRIPVGLAYTATQVNATVFRTNAVISAGPYQYVTYYAPDGTLVVAQRRLESERWTPVTLPVRGKVEDAHNCPVIGVSGDGLVHISYNHHSSPLHYRRMTRPHDLHSFGKEIAMTGKEEGRVTYPQFLPAPDGFLYFFYRDGASGNGNLCLNRYDPHRREWRSLRHPLIDGLGQCSPYWWRPSFGPGGSLHVAWCWRDSGDARTNHDICYMRSSDRGETWHSVTDRPLPLPITPRNAPLADRVPIGSNLINQCTTVIDRQGHPHLAHYQNDQKGIPQYTHLWHDGILWRRNVVTHRQSPFSLGGGGTLRLPLSRPEIAITRQGTVCLIACEADAGANIRLYRSQGRDYSRWTVENLTPPGDGLGAWEPTYDSVRLRDTGILSLFVLPVRQGDHEKATKKKPEEAYLLEFNLA